MAGDKKGALATGAMIVFMDESGFSQRPTVRRTWGRKGQTPILHEDLTWSRFSAMGAIGHHPGRRQMRLFLSLRPHAINSAEVIGFLKSLRRHVRDPVVLVWDNLPSHRSKVVRDYIDQQRAWLRVEYLPAYAPELNPVEDLWANLDGRELASFVPDDMEHLERQISKGARRVRRHDELLWSFFRHAQLIESRPTS